MARLNRIALLWVFVLAGCAALLPRPEPPRVTLVDLRLVDLKLLEQRYQLSLRIQNPNAFDLSIGGIDYELTVNDEEFGSGVSNRPVTIPAYGTGILEVDAYRTLVGLLRQLRELDPRKPFGLRYRLKGHLRLTGGDLRLPFEHSGEITLGLKSRGEGISL